LLRAGADVNLQSRDQKWTWTALHAACYQSKSVKLVEALLKAGADVNMVDSWGKHLCSVFTLMRDLWTNFGSRLRTCCLKPSVM